MSKYCVYVSFSHVKQRENNKFIDLTGSAKYWSKKKNEEKEVLDGEKIAKRRRENGKDEKMMAHTSSNNK